MHYVYLLKSKNYDENYIGSTNDLRRRFSEHNKGMEKSTKRYKPWRLVCYEAYQSEEDARERESKLKSHGNALRELKKRAQRSIKNGAGFAIVEVLVSIAVIIVMVLTFQILLAQAIKVSRSNRLELRATFYLREAIEVAKDLEKSNWDELKLSCTESNPCHPNDGGGYWQLVSGVENPDPDGFYTRSLFVEGVCRDANNEIIGTGCADSDTKKVTATVTWQGEELNLETYVYNY